MARVKWWTEGLLEVNVLLYAHFEEVMIRGMRPADRLQAERSGKT